MKMNKATWIWYPGDYEIWLGNKMNNRRTERGAFFPPFWKQDSHYVTVEFSRHLSLAADEEVEIVAEGRYNVKMDGKLLFGMPRRLVVPAGQHSLNIKVWNQSTPPALWVQGKTFCTDATWQVTNEDKEWIDESGKASDTSVSEYMDAGCWNVPCWDFHDKNALPSLFTLAQENITPKATAKVKDGTLYDFGRETFGYLVIQAPSGHGTLRAYYGESEEEALSTDHCETLDVFRIEETGTVIDESTGDMLSACPDVPSAYVAASSKALRYVYVVAEESAAYEGISLQYEYMPEQVRASFRCNDEEINRMWQVSERTLHLTTREFFIDGIKRDRWTWSGDAYQSYLMNYYLYFDSGCVRRTTWQLRGKDPVTAHVNTIMDYTFYWFLGIYDYYMYTGDRHFVEQIYPRMQSLMAYCLSRAGKQGMMEGLAGDWVFVDWSPQPMDKHGFLAFEQVLFCKSLETMALCARIVENSHDEEEYYSLYTSLRKKLLPTFWDETRHALIHNVVKGKRSKEVTRYANMFAIFFDYLNEEQKQDVARHVIYNDKVMPITTPYMQFYELEALCSLGNQQEVLTRMKEYWGGMLAHGATSFWEAYAPSVDADGLRPIADHLAMYGRPYGKSLCHAWGASPVYLLGKYFLGVKPVKPGYEEFEIKPILGGLEYMEGTVPTPNGEIKVYMDHDTIRVQATEGAGYLYFHSQGHPVASSGEIEKYVGKDSYRLWIESGDEVRVSGIS